MLGGLDSRSVRIRYALALVPPLWSSAGLRHPQSDDPRIQASLWSDRSTEQRRSGVHLLFVSSSPSNTPATRISTRMTLDLTYYKPWRSKSVPSSAITLLKVLPGAFSADSDRPARFEREVEVLASLNHPAIGAIYGLE